MRAHIGDHLLVHTLGRAAQGEFSQRGEVAGLEIVADGAFCLPRDVNLAFLKPLNQVRRGKIDQLDLVGLIDG